MSDTKLNSQSLEIVSLWEDAVCLHAFQKSLIPADLVRAKKRLAKLSSQGRARRSSERPFLFYRICVILARQGGSATMGELSDALGVPLSTATRLVNRLDRGGYVERLTDPNDHRIVRIVLTAEGKQLYQTIHDFAQQRVLAALNHFTLQERKQLVALLRKTISALATLPS
ncbi:MAG: MarR family transcriptional regulator [Chloroflexota bacterium]